jgi:predicted nucleic acid-binding protein
MRPRAPVHARWALVDTSAYFALTYSRETTSAAARAISMRLRAERWRLFTTNFILAETHALVLTRLNRSVAARVLADIDRSTTTIIRATAEDEQRARAILAQYQDKDFSLTDTISCAVMERLGFGYAFTFDHHFAQYGFVVLQST